MSSREAKPKDVWRRPRDVVGWIGLQPGQVVGEIVGGNGYWSHFFSEAVGKSGRVVVHNASEWKEFFDDYKIMDELEPCGKNTKFHWSSMESPFPEELNSVDVVFTYTNWHDLYDMPVDRSKLLSNIQEALKDDGVFCLVDHHALPGSGCDHSGSNSGLHRVEKALVLEEVLEAGFELVDDTDFLRSVSDNLLEGAWRSPQIETDRFALKFRKAHRKLDIHAV